ncbi:recombinase family protein [Actinomyces sp. zg296]|uniref:recombinase family protein n=1 Tax=Actinomyces sp. zg296 TaxID=2609289 RepID=UPI00135ADF1B|nr:recombinase family protein [Actinomyces sp. zg296]
MQQRTRPAAGQRVGYARVSTTDQRLDRQVAALGQVDRLFTDEASGSSRRRPGLQAALAYVRDGDELVVSSMDRLARSVRDLADLVDELTGRGVSVSFLREGQVYRDGDADPMSRLLLGVLGAVAEFERAIIRERQAEGIAAAKARGAYTGRTRSLTDADVERARARLAAGVPKAVIARDLGVHRSTLHRALNRQTE